MKNTTTTQLAQSASALGAGILGFGFGAKWGALVSHFALLIILIGAVFHVAGMYFTQMSSQAAYSCARLLWISAWVCLIALVSIIIYLLF